MKAITRLFAKPSAREIAAADLAEAEREYLKAIAAAEFYAAQAAYQDGLITRLSNYLRETP